MLIAQRGTDYVERDFVSTYKDTSDAHTDFLAFVNDSIVELYLDC